MHDFNIERQTCIYSNWQNQPRTDVSYLHFATCPVSGISTKISTARKFERHNYSDEGGTSYIDLIAAAGDAHTVVTLVNEFVADLASEGTLPQVPATGSDISIRDMKDAYCWLGMLISNVQQHACIIAPFQLVSIHAMLDTAFKKFKALGIR